jgi:hypothetical protein
MQSKSLRRNSLLVIAPLVTLSLAACDRPTTLSGAPPLKG